MKMLQLAICILALAASRSEALTITYDFEEDLGDLIQNPYNTVIWRQTTYEALENDENVASPVPRPENGGNGLAVVDLLKQVSGGAAVNTPPLDIPLGGKVSLAYWTRSILPEANGVQVGLLVNGNPRQEIILSLYDEASPDNNEFREASAEIPSGLGGEVEVWIYGNLGNGTSTDQVAIDNLSVTINEPTTTTTTTEAPTAGEEVCRDYTVTTTTTTTTTSTSTVTICDGGSDPPPEICPSAVLGAI